MRMSLMRNIRDKIFKIEKELEKLKESYENIEDESLREAIHIRLNEIKIEFMRLNQHYKEPKQKSNHGHTKKSQNAYSAKSKRERAERLENLKTTLHDGLLFVRDTSHLMTTEIRKHLPTRLKHKVDHAEDYFFRSVHKTEENIKKVLKELVN
jgi:hypothetical protein